MGYTNFLKGPTTYFASNDELLLSSEDDIIDLEDIFIFLEQRGVVIQTYSTHPNIENNFYINRMSVTGLGHKNIIKTALQALANKLDITSEGTIYYESDKSKKLTITTEDNKVSINFSKPKKKKKKI